MKKTVVIVAGGIGLRMGHEIPKQFISLAGKAIIFHTIDQFIKAVPEALITVVLPVSEMKRWEKLSVNTRYHNISVVAGGASRFESVRNGLAKVENGIVAVHDAVRPLVSKQTIQAAFNLAKDKGSAVPVIKLKDSIRILEEDISTAVERENFRLVQTPQCFEVTKLKAAYEQEYSAVFTDDASVFEADGNKVFLVDGNVENIKITQPMDLKVAEVLLSEITTDDIDRL